MPNEQVFRPRNTRTEIYVGRVMCCPLVSHVEYAPRALLRSEKRRDRQRDTRTDWRTDARALQSLSLSLDAASATISVFRRVLLVYTLYRP